MHRGVVRGVEVRPAPDDTLGQVGLAAFIYICSISHVISRTFIITPATTQEKKNSSLVLFY